MQANFSKEIIIANKFRNYLQCNGWKIIQLVCSGGQAHMSISFCLNGMNKNVFPDVIAIRENTILVGEIKNDYDFNDEVKLIEVSCSEQAEYRLKKNISLRCDLPIDSLVVSYSLINNDLKNKDKSTIGQFILDGDSFIYV